MLNDIPIEIRIDKGKETVALKDISELYAYYVIFEVFNGLLRYLYEINITNRCDGTLKYTKRYLKKHTKDDYMYQKLLDFVKESGGYCDCEVLYNFDADQYTRSGIYKKFADVYRELYGGA